MNIKSSLLTLVLIAGISCEASADSSRLKELMDASSSVSSISANVGSADLRSLLSHCESLEKLNKKSYDCKMLGKKQLIEAVKQGVSDFNAILSAEKEAQSKAEMNEKLKDIKVAVNKAQYFMEYLDICEKLKVVKANNPNSFNECKIDTVSDCEESDIATLKPIFEECIGSGNKNSGTGNFSDCGVSEAQKKIWNAVADMNFVAFQNEVNNGGNVNLQNCKGISLLYMAAAKGNTRMVQSLISYGANARGGTPSPICAAIDKRSTQTVKMIIKATDSGILSKNCDGTGDSVLFYAVKSGMYNLVQEMAGMNGSLVNERNYDGETPLHYAAKKQDVDMLKKLLINNNDVDICVTNDDGKTAYELLKEEYAKETLKPLLKCGY